MQQLTSQSFTFLSGNDSKYLSEHRRRMDEQQVLMAETELWDRLDRLEMKRREEDKVAQRKIAIGKREPTQWHRACVVLVKLALIPPTPLVQTNVWLSTYHQHAPRWA
jgi:hypothetical protein